MSSDFVFAWNEPNCSKTKPIVTMYFLTSDTTMTSPIGPGKVSTQIALGTQDECCIESGGKVG